METHRTYRYRCYPTEAQKRQLVQTFGCARYVCNWALEMRTDACHEAGESVGYYATKRRLTKLKQRGDHAWLYDVSRKTVEGGSQAISQLNVTVDSVLSTPFPA